METKQLNCKVSPKAVQQLKELAEFNHVPMYKMMESLIIGARPSQQERMK